MNYPNLYIRSLLEEIKELNYKMMNMNNEIYRHRYHGLSIFSEEIERFIKETESMSLEIEQLNQEIVNTIKLLDDNQ